LNARMWQPGGFHRPLAARERKWKTKTGKANFITPKSLAGNIDTDGEADVLQLTTFRSQGQFNTTVYNYRDRFRGVSGTRMVLFMNDRDIARLGLADGETVDLLTAVDDGVHREVKDFIVHAYDIPAGCAGGYFPECNPLVPVWHHAEGSFVPAVKGIPVRVRKSASVAATA
jgi:anaerobic selenocysteine-containing dehydrogenase